MTAGSIDRDLLTFEEARHLVESRAARVSLPEMEMVSILEAAGRVLGEPLFADRDLPPFPRSTRDGYAVRAADLVASPTKLQVIAEIKAGEIPDRMPPEVRSGQAVAIMTGAPVPQGADAVVMVEFTSSQNKTVEIARSVSPGENVVAQGAEAHLGTRLLDRGVRLNAAQIALAASVGQSLLRVFKRPQIAVLATGDEIVDLEAFPGPTQIRNSNSYSLAIQIRESGGEPVILPVAPDEPNRLRELIQEGLQSDLLLLTGGVSMGKYDLVEQVLSELGAEFFFTGAKIQPGRPVVFGRIPNGAASVSCEVAEKYFFGLPGNPISTMVTFELFARPTLEALAGMLPRELSFVQAKVKSEIRVKPGLKRFLPAMLSGEFENTKVELVPWQGSGDIAATARANCYVVIPADRERIAAGEFVAVMMH